MNNKSSVKSVPVKPPGVLKYFEAGILFLVLILYFSTSAVESEKREVLSEIVSTLSTAAISKTEQLEDWATDSFEEITTVTHSPAVLPSIERIFNGFPPEQEKKIFAQYLDPIMEIHKFTCLLFVSTEGKVVFRKHIEEKDYSQDEVAAIIPTLNGERDIRIMQLKDSSLCFAFFHPVKKNNVLIGYTVAGINAHHQMAEMLHSSKLLSLPIDFLIYKAEKGIALSHPTIGEQHTILPAELKRINFTAIPEPENYDPERSESSPDNRYLVLKNIIGGNVYAVPHRVFNTGIWLLTLTPEQSIVLKMNERITSTIVMAVMVGFIIIGLIIISALMERRGYTQTMLYNVQERAALEQHYKYLIKYANDIIFLLNAQSRILELNDRATETYLYSRDELTGRMITTLLPRSTGEVIPVEYTMSTGRFRTTHRRKDGTLFPAEVSIRRFSAGEEIYLQLIIRDITEWTNYENTIKESEERFRLLADNVSDIIYKMFVKPELKFEFISQSITRISGYTPQEFYDNPSLGISIVHPDDLPKIQKSLTNPSGPIEVRWVTKSGAIIWTEQLVALNYNENNEVLAIQGISRDITERRNAEIERERINRFNLLKGSVNEALLFSETEKALFVSVCTAATQREDFLASAIVTFSSGTDLDSTEQYGKTIRSTGELPEDEAKRIVDIILNNDIPAIKHLAGNQEKILYHTAGMIETSYSTTGHLRFLMFPLSSGSKLSGLFCLIFRADEDLDQESVALLDETARNISIRLDYLRLEEQRRQSDLELIKLNRQLKALTARLQELREDERISLSRQLHDELGQSLTALKIDLTLLQKQNGNGTAAQTQKTMELLNTIINSVRNISAELRPELLTQLGLLSAIHSHSKEMQRRTGINIAVQGDFGNLEDLEIETTFYRVYQEMVTNVVKHSHAKNVQVTLHNNEQKIALTVEDDGVGFNYNSENPLLSLGIIGMRERLARHGGKLIINTAPGQGSILTALIPLHTEV